MSNDDRVLAEMKCLEKGYWCGLEELSDMSGIPITEVAISIKSLKKQGLIYSEPIYNESTGLLNGKGWFIKNQ